MNKGHKVRLNSEESGEFDENRMPTERQFSEEGGTASGYEPELDTAT